MFDFHVFDAGVFDCQLFVKLDAPPSAGIHAIAGAGSAAFVKAAPPPSEQLVVPVAGGAGAFVKTSAPPGAGLT